MHFTTRGTDRLARRPGGAPGSRPGAELLPGAAPRPVAAVTATQRRVRVGEEQSS